MKQILFALCVITALGVVGVMGIEAVRPRHDNTQLIMTWLGLITTTVAVLLDVVKTSRVHTQINDLDSRFHSKLDAIEAKLPNQEKPLE